MAGVSGSPGGVPGALVGLGVPSKTGGPHQGSVTLPFSPQPYSQFFHGRARALGGPKHPKGWEPLDCPAAGVELRCTTSSSGPFRLHNARRGAATTTTAHHGPATTTAARHGPATATVTRRGPATTTCHGAANATAASKILQLQPLAQLDWDLWGIPSCGSPAGSEGPTQGTPLPASAPKSQPSPLLPLQKAQTRQHCPCSVGSLSRACPVPSGRPRLIIPRVFETSFQLKSPFFSSSCAARGHCPPWRPPPRCVCWVWAALPKLPGPKQLWQRDFSP